jgi:uncharacterized membrane protein YtjA (UPF0391 family)
MGIDFLIVAIVAAVFGFTGIAAAAAGIAQIIFFIFLVLLIPFCQSNCIIAAGRSSLLFKKVKRRRRDADEPFLKKQT